MQPYGPCVGQVHHPAGQTDGRRVAGGIGTLAVIMDNAGQELVADLVLLWWLTTHRLVKQVGRGANARSRAGGAAREAHPVVCVRRHGDRPGLDSGGSFCARYSPLWSMLIAQTPRAH
jgi:hypothetical protein